MRWVIVGASGMLGSDLVFELQNEDCLALKRAQVDITNISSLRNAVTNCSVVVNCAAYTAVDDAEHNKELAFRINSDGARNLATVCAEIGAKLVQISTDYVFDGKATTPYSELEQTNPQSVYGSSKLAGELAVQEILPDNHYIIRTAWLYGKNGKNFAKTMLNLSKTNQTLSVVDDQFGQPTWTRDLSQKIIELVNLNSPNGIYHGTSEGQTSWFDFARFVFSSAGLDPERIKPVKSDSFPRPAQRPNYSVLSHGSFKNAGIEPIRNWQTALTDAFSHRVFND